jgi:hypothetical protein
MLPGLKQALKGHKHEIRRITPPRFFMAEDSRNKNDDDVELSEEEIKEAQRLEANKTAKQKNTRL